MTDVTLVQIKALRMQAIKDNNTALVWICTQALHHDADAREECARIIASGKTW